MELDILKFWRENDCFKTSLKLSEGLPEFTFYDGPPFATGLPHYGHLLAGSLKDVVTRYAHQTGHHVQRRFGWDCHGLPVEYEIDKKLGVTNRSDIIDKIGIKNYNDACRGIVMKYAKEWEATVERIGRWIDFENGYKTMNVEFMESVWWVFKQLFLKGLVYKDYKVMPYSTACSTPISNFEASQNYKDVSDPSIIVSFPVRSLENVSERFAEFGDIMSKSEFLAWTTTPWTIPANMALTVHPEFVYSLFHVKETNRYFWVADCRADSVLKDLKLVKSTKGGAADKATDEQPLYEWISKGKYTGADLAGIYYEPAYTTFWKIRENWPTAWRVIADSYVTSDSGTGIVHCAPAYGEDDARVALANGITKKGGLTPLHVDDSGSLMNSIMDEDDLKGVYVKSADKIIRKQLKDRKRLLFDGSIMHSYPHCWRSDTPLIYRAVPSWFVNVESIKDALVETNRRTVWVPSHIQERRFHNWLCDARDWCVSRNRFWGTPVPLWVSEDGEVMQCMGSIKELEDLTGAKLTDIHRHFIDDLVIPDPRGESYPSLKRVDEVFDCWFESGSMPYASKHYPFENEQAFNDAFPADFVGEGLDQTRGWFYTLSVLGCALFGTAPFKHLIVNGLVLAEDGKKMSKRLKNYPDPADVFKKFGADALRIYLISSPALRAESLKFKEDGLKEVMKNILLPWYHALRFLTQEVTRYEIATESQFESIFSSADDYSSAMNDMDKWILSMLNSLVKFVHEEMTNYKLYSACSNLLAFMDQLTNWYVRLNRERMRGSDAEGLNQRVSLSVLHKVLYDLTLLMSPFAPFMAEFAYQQLSKIRGTRSKLVSKSDEAIAVTSVHYLYLPQFDEGLIDLDLEYRVNQLQNIIVLGRQLRDRKKLSMKQCVSEISIHSSNQRLVDAMRDPAMVRYIQSELNCLKVNITFDADSVRLSALPALKLLGQKYGQKLKALGPAIRELTGEQLERLQREGMLRVLDVDLTLEDVLIQKTPVGVTESETLAVECSSDVLLSMNIEITPELRAMHVCREYSTRIQKLRKELGLNFDDNANITYIEPANEEEYGILTSNLDTLQSLIRRKLQVCRIMPTDRAPLGRANNIAIFVD